MKATANLLWHPFKYPEWGEMLCAFMGLGQFIFAMTYFADISTRASMQITVLFGAFGWASAGLLLFVMHIGALRWGKARWGHTARLIAVGSSLVFWNHLILSIVVNSVFFGGPIPATIVPAMGTPLLAGAVLYRLWRRYV